MSVRTDRFRQMHPVRIGLLFLVSAIFLMTAAFSASAAPEAQAWPHWERHDRHSDLSIDHSSWTEFLQKYVRTDDRGINRVAYGEVTKASRSKLDDYIAMLTLAPIATYTRQEQLAYWINLYNALTVRVILAYFPVESIMDIKISPGWFAPGPWGKKLLTIDRRQLSLDDIEHRILRPIWKDPRIHYALNCASIGCPNLQKRAFTAETADKMLTAGATAYINHWRGAEFIDGGLYVSSIYSWFIDDFGGSNRGVLRHLRQFAEPELKRRLEKLTDVAGHRYDWSLNIDRRPE